MSQPEEPKAEEALKAIFRARGSTKTERLLADLGDHAFLNLWSYPNLFFDKKQKGKGDGKELCDMLVVCGDDVIIFSDKSITYPEGKDVRIAWPRYYRKAVDEAVKQINGANRVITDFPEKIYTEPACTQRLPIGLPPAATRRMHGVVVASGAYKAVQTHCHDDSGSFLILPSMKGEAHIEVDAPGYMPFCVGDVNPEGMFIHVFDDVSIKRLLENLDTITDFTTYLNKRAEYLRTDNLMIAHGEEELLARYLMVGMATGEPTFEFPNQIKARKKAKRKNAKIINTTLQGEWAAYLFSDGYLAKSLANDDSKVWDNLINVFTKTVLEGTVVSVFDEVPNTELSERGLRFMAMENRFSRRILGEAVNQALAKALELKTDRYARVIFKGSSNPKLAYILMILAYPTDLEQSGGLEGGYEQYRRARVAMLHAYCLNVLQENRNLNTAVAINGCQLYANRPASRRFRRPDGLAG